MAATHGDEGDQAYRAIRRRLDATAERFGLGNGRKGHRFADRAADHVRAVYQPQDRQGARALTAHLAGFDPHRAKAAGAGKRAAARPVVAALPPMWSRDHGSNSNTP